VNLVNRNFSLLAAIGFVFLSVLPFSVSASNEALTDLLKVLMEKGTITADEYTVLKAAAQTVTEKTSIVSADKMVTLETKTRKLSAETNWAEKIRIEGDIRTRYQYEKKDGNEERSRGRIRYRLGVIANPITNWTIGGGLASGGSDPRSTNQDMKDGFSTKQINLDYAYIQYKHGNTGLKAIAGKFKRKKYLWAPTDVMWDSDINPEGAAFSYAPKLKPLWLNAGVFVLEENKTATQHDSHMGYGQLGLKFKSNAMFGKLAGTLYMFGQMKDAGSSAYVGAGETNTDNNLGSFNLAAEVGTKVGGGKFSAVGEYINNYETNTNESSAYIIGFKYQVGKLQMKYLYADIEENAVPDFLPDSDRFGGETGIKGHELIVGYTINKNVSMSIDYYLTKNKFSKREQDMLQLDLNVKF
jgi:hypothetical protein